MNSPMSSSERLLTTLAGGIPDRVPYFLPVTMHGATEVGVGLDEYFRSGELVAEGQLRLRRKYRDDICYLFFYGAIEHLAFGGEVEFFPDSPPNALGPLLTSPDQIERLEPPSVADSPVLAEVLTAIEICSRELAGEALVVGVIMAPFSLPVMQLGFGEYLTLLAEQPELAARLVELNTDFAVEWANAQLTAGANAIGYFDPLSSRTVLDDATIRRLGLPTMIKAMTAINGPCAALFASGLAIPALDALAQTPAVIVGASSDEDLREVKAAAPSGMTVMGNLNGIEMRRWSPDEAFDLTRAAIAAGAPGGRFILSDTHGEIPIQVSSDVLLAITAAVEEFGIYPPAERRPR